jgi:hypothetical protein
MDVLSHKRITWLFLGNDDDEAAGIYALFSRSLSIAYNPLSAGVSHENVVQTVVFSCL